jgi:hypothetical protein
VRRDRTWFFGAGRFIEQTVARETAATRVPYNFVDNQKRFEGKLTQSLGIGRRLQVAYTGIQEEQVNNAYPSASEVMDLNALTTRELPQSLLAAHYAGLISPRLAIEAQYSARRFRFKRDGGTNTDLIRGTPLIDAQTGAFWWAPAFCGVCADETRNNDAALVKGTYLLSTGAGAHNMTFGYDTFNDKVGGDLHQSATDYHVYSSASTVRDGVVYPVFEPGFSAFVVHWPVPESSLGTNFRTHAFFFNDVWAANRHLSLNLGVRWDQNRGRDASGTLIARDRAVSPRLGVLWDPAGDGRTTVSASAGRYVAAIANNIASSSSRAGLSSILVYAYFGDPINSDPEGPLVPTDDALRQVFDWYGASGGETLIQATIPGIGLRIPTSLRSPYADEVSVGVSRQVGATGTVRFDVVSRKFGDFYGERIDTATGQASDEFGQVVDVSFIENSNVPTRRYLGFNAQAMARLEGVHVGASYTLSRLRGNFNGETGSSGPVASSVLRYPEYRELSWFSPEGDLSADQRHRVRAWGVFDVPFSEASRLSLGVSQQLESGTPYGAVGTILMFDANGSDFVGNPGYNTPPQTQNYFFTPRHEFRTATMFRTDVSASLGVSFGPRRQTEFYVQAHILNVLNQFQAFDATSGQINRTVLTANDDPGRFAPFNPFTETPVRGVHWELGENFGKPTAASAYTLPRTLRFSVGVRF